MKIMRRLIIIGVGVLGLAVGFVVPELPSLAAGGLLHPARRRVTVGAPKGCDEVALQGVGVTLKGWRCGTAVIPRATIVYLHGVADNRVSATGIMQRFTSRGYDVVAYDSRGHGESDGDMCTYGYFEKHDLHRVIDTIPSGRIILIGSSLGAAVALQESADDPRITAIVAAESFADLESVAHANERRSF